MFRSRAQTVDDTRIPVKTKRRHRIRNVAVAAAGAVQAQRHVRDDLKAAKDSYKHSLTSGIGLFAGAGVLALAAAVLLTVGIVVWLNVLLGSPVGYFLVALGYLLIAGIMVFTARKTRSSHKEEAREHVEEAREEVRHVTRPMRHAFGKDGIERS